MPAVPDRRRQPVGPLMRSSVPYRAEIDGLRALAVLPVVLFHAGYAGLPGGFLGVDVFFVISGYLITAILRREMADGTFTLTGFYARRARRILPALGLVTACAMLLAVLLLLPAGFTHFVQRVA